MLYLVRIIQKTSGDNFTTLVAKPVSTPMTQSAVRVHFERLYPDFTILVSRFEDIPIELDMSGQNFLTDIPVKYTDTEKVLHEKLILLRDKTHTAECDLHEAIIKRYKELHYTCITSRNPMTLATDSEETIIKCLPIQGSVFIQNIGEGKEV
jgi:hypothetical protein